MGLITFMSDFGYRDHYVTAVKARIFNIDPTIPVIDITHAIQHHDFAHGSYVLNAVFREFPLGTAHIAAVGSYDNLQHEILVVKLEGHYFIGYDSGFLSLISEREPENVVKIDKGKFEGTFFPEKDIFAPVAVLVAKGTALEEIGAPYIEMKKMIGRKTRATKKLISGNVTSVDHYGNLITNIDKTVFDILSKEKTFKLVLGREILTKINTPNNFSEDGEIFAIFNSNGFLEIGINKGNASELLNLHFDSNISIVFPD